MSQLMWLNYMSGTILPENAPDLLSYKLKDYTIISLDPFLFIKEMTSKWELTAFILSIQIYSEDESCAVFATCKLYFKWIHSVFCCRIYGQRGFSIESQPFLEGIVRLFKRVRNTGRKFLTSVFRNFQNEQEISPLYCVRNLSKQPLLLSQIIPWQSM